MRSQPISMPELVTVAILAVLVALAMPAVFQPGGGRDAVIIRDLSPADGSRVPARPIRLSAEIQGERELHSVRLLVNDSAVEPFVERLDPRRWRVSANLSQLSGETRIQMVARDRHGRQRAAAVRLLVDTQISAPTIGDLQPPPKGFAPAGGARFSAAIQSDAPIDRITLQVGGTTVVVPPEPANAMRLTATSMVTLTPGSYEAVLTVVDREGDTTVMRWTVTVPDPKEMLAFEQTGRAISGGFRLFWQEKGGLAIFGMPISEELREGNLTVQYFERARLEYHPRDDGLLSEVRLGLIGSELRRPDPPRPSNGAADTRYFNETGHSLGGPFRRFWEEKGGVGLFGLPITEEVREGNLTVQYFERARLELHSNAGSQVVLLGLIGRELYERRQATAPARSTP